MAIKYIELIQIDLMADHFTVPVRESVFGVV